MKNTTRIPNFITSAPTTDSERVSPDCLSLSPNDTQPEDSSDGEESKRDDALTSPQKEGRRGRERSA